MSNVVQFPGSSRFGTVVESTEPDYSVHIRYTATGLSWEIDNGQTIVVLAEDTVANDLASIALSLRPPPLTLWQRIKILFTGATP